MITKTFDRITRRSRCLGAGLCALGAVLLLVVLSHASAASAAPLTESFRSPAKVSWAKCSKSAGGAAARQAGFSRALDAEPVLRRVFGSTRPSSVYKTPTTSLCGDFDRDGDTDRAVLYQCCTVSSPAPWLVLRGRGPSWRIAYKRLHDTTFKLEADGARLVTTEPQYSSSDALCCPSKLRIGLLRWTGRAFKRTFRVRSAKGAQTSRASAAARRARPVYGVQSCTTPRVRPTVVIFTCGDAGMLMQHIRWRRWGGSAR